MKSRRRKSPSHPSPKNLASLDMVRLLLACITVFGAIAATSVTAQTRPDKGYLVYVLSESADRIAPVIF